MSEHTRPDERWLGVDGGRFPAESFATTPRLNEDDVFRALRKEAPVVQRSTYRWARRLVALAAAMNLAAACVESAGTAAETGPPLESATTSWGHWQCVMRVAPTTCHSYQLRGAGPTETPQEAGAHWRFVIPAL
jgi:hypothetical protein